LSHEVTLLFGLLKSAADAEPANHYQMNCTLSTALRGPFPSYCLQLKGERKAITPRSP
jgi:hypothetical protein